MTETERFVGNVYQNVRGLKSKIVSLAETIDDYEPTNMFGRNPSFESKIDSYTRV